MTNASSTKTPIIVALLVLLALLAGASLYFWNETRVLKEGCSARSTEYQAQLIAKETKILEANNTIALLTEELDERQETLDELEDDYRVEKKKNDIFEDQISAITGTVKDLDKLSKTDEELLQKYSKVYFLNENYIPSDIDEIDKRYILAGKEPQFFHGDALSFLEDMLDEAEDDNIDLQVVSAYRSFDHQEQLKGQYTTVYGSGANTFSADQGYSEHQLGTTVDLTDTATGGTFTTFKDTEAYEWLLENAHKYGFTLSYSEDNNFYVFEPWHWRFVGVDLAKDLHRADESFYDWEQRKIDSYLLTIFD